MTRRISSFAVVVGLALSACTTSAGTSPSVTDLPSTTTSSTVPEAAPTATATSSAPSTTASTSPTTTSPVPLDEIGLDVVPVADGFDQPILATTRSGDDRLIVADQSGVVFAVDLDSGTPTVLLDIEGDVRFSGEQGLLGVAFRPDGTEMFVHYSANDGATFVVGYQVADDGIAVEGTRRVILTHPQPAGNHNGGMIEFGPDGYLYVALGDGGGANDRFDNGQNPFTWLGAILRIDVDAGDPYVIPPDNPFVDAEEGSPEVWAWGLRNPWRFSFDGTDLWVGDVGQGAWEEIDLFDANRPGDNAGWPLLEGRHCFRVEPCDFPDLLGPVIEYRHEAGRCSVTGGVVYRGEAIPQLVGTYLYGDYCTGEIWGLRLGPSPDEALLTDASDTLLPSLPGLTSFGVGPDAEAYVLQAGGTVWRLVGA